MKTFFGTQTIDLSYPPSTIVALGNFDGVHLGHQMILAEAFKFRKKLGLPVVCFTFNPHPTLELKPLSKLKLLMTYDEKREFLASAGVDYCVEEPFDRAFAATSAVDFFEKILRAKLRAKVIVVGDNFNFGKNREGNIERLREFCLTSGVELHTLHPIEMEGGPVSSSRIREALSHGDVALAKTLLGRPFFYRAEIVHGDKRGRTIGFPTANMKCEEKLPLKSGVYASSVIWRGKVYPSITNLGVRPTFQSTELKMETHLLNQDVDLYGEILEVQFHARVRDERKFASIDELKVQIQSDVNLATQLLSSRNF